MKPSERFAAAALRTPVQRSGALGEGLEGRDPLALQLADVQRLHACYEAQMVGHLAKAVPSLKNPLNALLERMIDLLQIIRPHYYHPEFHGSFSIKSVLPALVPQMKYDGMEVSDGDLWH